MEALRTLAILLPLGLSSGINLYATVLVAGLTIRFGLVQDPPAGLDVLAAWPVIIAAAAFYIVEFLADKIQFVDNAWDLIHTFIRPLGAAVLAWAVLSKTDPTLAVLGALATGSLALVSHSSKAGTRVALNVTSPFENISNTGVSLAEDVVAVALTYLALTNPWLAGAVALVVVILLILLVPRLLRWSWFALRALIARLRSLGQSRVVSDALPMAHAAPLAMPVLDLVIAGRAQNIKEVGTRDGYLVMGGGRVCFTYQTRSGVRAWCLGLSQVGAVRLAQHALVDVVSVGYQDARGKERTARFAFFKDRATLAEQAALRLAASPANVTAPAVLPAQVP